MVGLHFQYHFGELFGVVFTHAYYSDMKCKDLQIVPTQETANLLKNYQLIFKQNLDGDGFKIAYLKGEESKNVMAVLDKMITQTLRFTISVKNKLFLNFSDLSLGYDKIMCISNHNKTADKKGEVFDVLSQKEMLKKLDTSDLNNLLRTNTAVRIRNDKNEVTTLPNQGSPVYLKQGRYTMETDKNTEYYVGESLNDWGVLEITIESLKSHYTRQKDNPKSITYQIPFEARATYWTYIVATYGDTVYEDYQIECETNKKITFHRGEDYTHSSGKKCPTFVSDTPIPIHQRHKEVFILKLIKKGKNNIRNVRLAVASNREIVPIKGKGYQSVIFVNVFSPVIGDNQ